jgi:hypothetical protein
MAPKMSCCARLLKFLPVAATLGCASVIGGIPAVAPPSLDLAVAAPPETTSLPATLDEIQAPANRYAWDHFAWQTFVALNWPAVPPTAANGYLRGFPDLSDPANVNFVNAGRSPGPLVWETFIEKREMFDHDAKTAADARPQPWNSPYSKSIFGNGKFNTLDETVEVRAEALEGYRGADAALTGTPAVARVFRGTVANSDTAVRYEVKMNYDFYKYVVDNGLYFDPAADARSRKSPPVQLPWRTSLPEPGVQYLTQKPAEPPYVQGYLVENTLAAYRAGAAAAAPGHEVLPPRLGAIHIKAAWAKIDKEKEGTKFITRDAEYFSGPSRQRETGTFGLIGLHIIQRIKVAASPGNLLNSNALGGTFLFSTWEHKDIRETPGGPGTQYTYTNYFPNEKNELEPHPGLDDPFYVYRLYPILGHTQQFNQRVWDQVGADSVWFNYRLVGTQFLPVDIKLDGPIENSLPGKNEVPSANLQTNSNDPTGIGQPVYLSNLVIETNLGLQQFQGQPPAVKPVAQFAGSVTFNPSSKRFLRTASQLPPTPMQPAGASFGNLRFGGIPASGPAPPPAYNMGGCMGCHGVAQLNGFSFSFVLLGGQAGADPDSETAFDVPFTADAQKSLSLLLAGDSAALQSSAGTYLAGSGSQATLQADPVQLKILGADGRPAGSPFRFGDGILIEDGSGQFLTAAPAISKEGPSPVFFAAEVSRAAVWYLYDSENPGSTGDVLRLDKLSFRNAAVVYPAEDRFPGLPLPAVLSSYRPAGAPPVGTVNHASTQELWSVHR